LDSGTLYVARFTGDSSKEELAAFTTTGMLPADGAFDGTGQWLPLTSDTASYVPGFSVEEVLIHTRLAADAAGRTQSDGTGPTKMDRPEDIKADPVTGRVYCSLTNNTRRTAAQVDEANPRPANKDGHVLELVERHNDAAATSFGWRLFLVAGDPTAKNTYFAGYDKSRVSPISCPDNLAFDPIGNLWIATDGNALDGNDGFFAVPTQGPERGHVKQFLTVPVGAETCGPIITADCRTAIVAVQHPGEVDGATVDSPVSTFPYGDHPRPTVICVWRTAPGSQGIGT
jgi:secreted PhoX family phosphatase